MFLYGYIFIVDLELVSDKEYFMKFYICIMERATDKQKWLLKNVQSSEQVSLQLILTFFSLSNK